MNYSNAALYDFRKLDVTRTAIPHKPLLATGSCLILEKNTDSKPLVYTIPPESDPAESLREGKIVITIAREVIGLLCVFGYATRKTLSELLIMRGFYFSNAVISKVYDWLDRHNMVVTFTIEDDDIKLSLYGLTEDGLQAARRMRFSYHPKLYARECSEEVIKTYAQTAQLVSNFLSSGLPIDSFCVRQMLVTDASAGGIVRPSAYMRIGGELVVLEVVRRYDGWEEHLLDKLTRYNVLIDFLSGMTLIINGEDSNMNRTINRMLLESGISLRPLYTEDLRVFGDGFRSALYGIDENGFAEAYEMVVQATA